MHRFAKVQSAMGAGYLVISLSALHFIGNLRIMHGGMYSLVDGTGIESESDWAIWFLIFFLHLRFVGTGFLLIGGMFYVFLWVTKKLTASPLLNRE